MIVDDNTVIAAYTNFKKLFYPNVPGVGMHLWAFVGLKKSPHTLNPDNSRQGDGWEMPEDAAHRISLLAGPHHETVAKILLLRGHQHKIPLGAKTYEPDPSG